FHILSSLPRLFRGNEKYENLTRPQSIEQICDSESLNLGTRGFVEIKDEIGRVETQKTKRSDS
ncbi:MAG: hypothetical protein PF517_14910, partial [Salinivirgaceae bacterium]|nr:hypothetical protein [Salinivirgaceae bacterium]